MKESKEKRVEPREVNPEVKKIELLIPASFSEEKRKEQLRLGKMIFEFFEEKPVLKNNSISEKKGQGRPRKTKSEMARNITICLSKEHIELLDCLSLFDKKAKGRGTRIKSILEGFLKYRKREKEQVKVVQDALAQVGKHLIAFSDQYKRAEKFNENEMTISALEKAISNFKIIFSLLKVEPKDLRNLLTKEETDQFEFCLNWISNRSGGNQ